MPKNLELFMEVSEEPGSLLSTHVLFTSYFRQYTKMWTDRTAKSANCH